MRQLESNCGLKKGGSSEACIHGCLEDRCCVHTAEGVMAHLCLSQLLKQLGRDPTASDVCGTCKKKLKEG